MNFNKKALIAAAGNKKPSNPWELEYAKFDGVLPLYVGGTLDSTPTSFAFNSDGTRLYVAGQTRDVIFERKLATPYSPGTADIVKYNIPPEVPNATKIDISENGGTLVITDDTANVYYYTLTVPHDFDTAVYNGTVSFSGYVTTIKRARIDNNGTLLHILDDSNVLRQFSLSTAYDISTYTYTKSFTVSGTYGTALSFHFRSGTNCTIATTTSVTPYTISFGDPWDLTKLSINSGSAANISNIVDTISTPGYNTIFTSTSQSTLQDYQGGFLIASLLLSNLSITGSVLSFCTTDKLVIYLLMNTGTSKYITGIRIRDINTNISNSFQGMYIGDVESAITSMCFSADGTKVYYVGGGIDTVRVLNLSSPWQIYSATASTDTLATPGNLSNGYGLHFKPDGSKLFIVDSNIVYSYNLSTPWNITTATASSSFSVGLTSRGITFSQDGTRLFVNTATWIIRQYDLTTAWDLSTVSIASLYEFTTFTRHVTTTTTGWAIQFDSTGKKFYRIETTSDVIYCYQLDTAYDLSTIKNNYIMGVAVEEASPNTLYFNSAGTVMYVLGQTGDDINNYTLSTPWDLTTAYYSGVYSVAAQTGTTPTSIALSNTGSKIYVLSNTFDTVFEYLTTNAPYFTAPDVSNTGSLSVASQQTNPYGIAISEDNSKFYIVGLSPFAVHEYTLSIPGSLNTGTYSGKSFSLVGVNPRSIFFGKQGTRMYISDVSTSPRRIVQYNLSTAYDITTAVYYTAFPLPAIHVFGSIGLYFKPDGKSFYTVDFSSDMVVQFNIG